MLSRTTRIFQVIALFFVFGLLAPGTIHGQTPVTCARDIIVQSGDTLSTLAARYLGGSLDYNRIVEATNTKAAADASYTTIDNPNMIAVGWKLCLPGSAAAALAPVSPLAQPAVAPSAGAEISAESTLTATDVLTETVSQRPLTIAYLRDQSYPGSAITIEQTLAPGANYNRYLVSYRSEGLKIYALMTVPTGTRPSSGWPAIIFNHGYIPPELYRTTERYVAYVDAFARNGYVVFKSDYRGHGSSEGKADGAYGSPDYTIDVLNALASVKRYPGVDPNRIGMWGHSMGGYITLRAMVVSKDIKAGVIWAGVVGTYKDLLTSWHNHADNFPVRARRWRTELIAQHGTPDENPAFWNSISANSYVADLSGPLQLHHDINDSEVPILFAEHLRQEILNAGGSVEYYTYPGDDHNLSKDFQTAMDRSVAFFDRYVKNSGATAQPAAAQ